ncbi:hypothetical protein HY479_04100 [Candidatus Uhrbacteria bacterium]|nr:hypothetical protein [Candidatus Uhrbacteria bacterium]
MSKKKHNNAEEIESGLTAIYRDDGGDVPDLTKLEPVKSRWWLYTILAGMTFVFVLVAAAWAGFSLFKPFRGFTGQGLELQVEGPESVSLGQETTYFINYRNRTSEPIASAELRISFPSDFVVSELDPRPVGEEMTWKLGALPVEGRGTIKIRGVFTGALGTTTALQVVGSYRPASFNSDFEALATKVLQYANSVLNGTLIVPAKVLPGDRVAFSYAIENAGETPFEGLESRITLPEGFQLDATSTNGTIDGRVWRVPLPVLAAGASTTVVVRGSFASGVSGEAHVVAETGRTSSEGAFLPSQRTETSFTVLAGDLSLKLVVNGNDTDQAIAYGSPLRFGISYENTATEDLRDVTLRLRVEAVSSTPGTAPLVDWATLEDNASGTRKGNVITWGKEQVVALKRLPPREDGFIDVGVTALQRSAGFPSLAFRVTLEAEIGAVGSETVKRVVKSAPITLRYLTDATADVEARYFSEEGAPIGSGPLPPVVGQTTTYRIQWTVSKKFHELKDMKMSASLPKIASWPGATVVDAGEVSYDEQTRTVRWMLNRLPAIVNESTVTFSVAITPTEADANRFAQLLGETRFEATDAETATLFTRTAPALTTDLENDEAAQGKGVVRKP